ncbi:hypothetical protein B603_0977 [Chlamydia psittaci WC]|nr:hypothetical protein B595_1039 [Chlamydia psittaci 84/55]AFS25660.1 hypothetical protein B603_0977 [Chlamydia psittaci WC]
MAKLKPPRGFFSGGGGKSGDLEELFPKKIAHPKAEKTSKKPKGEMPNEATFFFRNWKNTTILRKKIMKSL